MSENKDFTVSVPSDEGYVLKRTLRNELTSRLATQIDLMRYIDIIINWCIRFLTRVILRVLEMVSTWDETQWLVALFCVFAMGCFYLNGAYDRRRI